MILQKNEIEDIIKKAPTKKNIVEFSEEECLNLIETYIFYKTGKKIGNITKPTSTARQGVTARLLAIHQLELMHEATNFAWHYFIKEFNEQL